MEVVAFPMNPLHSIHLNTIDRNRCVHHNAMPTHATADLDTDYFLVLWHILCVAFVMPTYEWRKKNGANAKNSIKIHFQRSTFNVWLARIAFFFDWWDIPHCLHWHWFKYMRSIASANTKATEIYAKLITIRLNILAVGFSAVWRKNGARILTHRHLIGLLYRLICAQLSQPLFSHYNRCPISMLLRSRSHSLAAVAAAVVVGVAAVVTRDWWCFDWLNLFRWSVA